MDAGGMQIDRSLAWWSLPDSDAVATETGRDKTSDDETTREADLLSQSQAQTDPSIILLSLNRSIVRELICLHDCRGLLSHSADSSLRSPNASAEAITACWCRKLLCFYLCTQMIKPRRQATLGRRLILSPTIPIWGIVKFNVVFDVHLSSSAVMDAQEQRRHLRHAMQVDRHTG
jgi:hypothetical protein